MFILNITYNLEPPIEQEWLHDMTMEHIPDVLNTNKFMNHRVLRLVNEHPDANGNTYAIQFMATKIADIQAYLAHEGAILENKVLAKYGESIVSFSTVLEEI
jgi:hypothetical protein